MYDDLKPYATSRQVEYIIAIGEHGSHRKAAAALGVSAGSVDKAILSAKRRAARHGHAPDSDMVHTVPDGFLVKGTSTMYGPDGEVKAQWVKSQIDKDRQEELMREGIKALCEEIKPVSRLKAPTGTNKHLCNLYTITDFHVGMLAWGEETAGEDWDTAIAEETLFKCFSEMVHQAPDAEAAVICQLGDFLHQDGILPMTGTAGTSHILDSDTRYAKIVRTSIKLLRMVVDMALAKHSKVHLINAEGNHDLASSVWLRECFAVLYSKEPRVTVETSPLPFYVFKHGKTMLGFHHGHLKKFDKLTAQFAAQFPSEWGDSTHRYAHSGHLHHVHVKEDMGMTLTQHPTLSTRDSYSSRHGFFSERRAMWVSYHDEYGEVASGYIKPEMVR